DANELWYKRSFSVPSSWRGRDVMLNFGAVDWKADVFVNDVLIGSHKGGYTPFSLNVTPFLSGKGEQKLVVRVWDPSDKGYQPRGKQVSNPEGIWYTPVTGIWQTVWIEPVASAHVKSIKSIPDIDNGVVHVTVSAEASANDVVEVRLMDKGNVITSAKGLAGNELRLAVDNPTLWEPSNPYLYGMSVSVIRNGKRL
ncbi:glycosyl hydrolase, family 2, partial [gut metagenome]